MKSRSIIVVFLTCALVAPASLITPTAAQQTARPTARPQPAATPPPPATPQQSTLSPDAPNTQDDEVVQITTNLVQVDAIVTDRNGRQVTDLKAEDFEVFENGERQEITNFSYVALTPQATPTPATVVSRPDRNAPPIPPVRLRPEQVRRTIALVVDDLQLSFESVHFVRQALKKYVDEQMGPNDLAAIIRTRAGVGALQQFTSDKRMLYRAIERVRWNPSGRGGISAFAPISSFDEQMRQAQNEGRDEIEKLNSERESLDNFREEIFTVGTLGALNYVVRGLREMPGRKAVVLFSDGLELFNRISTENGGGVEAGGRVLDAMRRLTDLANRASVVFYTLDARGLQTLGLTAADDVSGISPQRIGQLLADRSNSLRDSQEGLIYLARETGGFNVRNSNDLAGGVRRVLEDQRGYYLIGYRPDERTFDPATGRRRFNKIEVKIKDRRGLTLRTRSGFIGIPTEEARPVRRTRGEQLAAALSSPFGNDEVTLRLTSFFGNDEPTGSFVRSMLHIDGRALTFTEESDGWRKTVIDVLALTFDGDGKVIDSVNRVETVRARGDAYADILKSGAIYALNLPVKKPGAYQLRVAVRDAATERTGSASQFIEVPNLKKNHLTLSGIVVTAGADAGATATVKTGGVKADEPQATPALRHFRPGAMLDYGYQIYNARLDSRTNRPQLQTQVRLFRDGQQIFASSPAAFDANRQIDPKRFNINGRLQLGTNMQSGEYVLQVIVTDLLAKQKTNIATQWIDFEIVK